MKEMKLTVGERTGSVNALLLDPKGAKMLYVFAHGAGANMHHAFMQTLSERLAAHGVATLRYNFPYMESGKKSPDVPAVLEATVRAAIELGASLADGRTLLAGGKSMGGRMTSQLMAKHHDDRVAGLAFVGFPLHQPGKPGIARAAHLSDVRVPMLFLQGTRDSLADLDMMKDVCAGLGENARLHIIDGADHSFAVLKRTGRTADEVMDELAATISGFGAALR